MNGHAVAEAAVNDGGFPREKRLHRTELVLEVVDLIQGALQIEDCSGLDRLTAGLDAAIRRSTRLEALILSGLLLELLVGLESPGGDGLRARHPEHERPLRRRWEGVADPCRKAGARKSRSAGWSGCPGMLVPG